MGLIARTVSSRVVDELSVRLAGATESAIDEIVRRRSDAIKTAVEVERLRHPDVAPRDLARMIVYQRSKLSAVAGAVSSLPGAFPGVGTAAEIGAGLADTVALVYSQVALILAVATAFDHDLDAHDERAADVRVVLALDAGAAKFGKRGVVELADGGAARSRRIARSRKSSTASSARWSSSARRAAARARCSGARSRSASASRSAPARTSRRCATRAARHCATTSSPPPARSAPDRSPARTCGTPAVATLAGMIENVAERGSGR